MYTQCHVYSVPMEIIFCDPNHTVTIVNSIRQIAESVRSYACGSDRTELLAAIPRDLHILAATIESECRKLLVIDSSNSLAIDVQQPVQINCGFRSPYSMAIPKPAMTAAKAVLYTAADQLHTLVNDLRKALSSPVCPQIYEDLTEQAIKVRRAATMIPAPEPSINMGQGKINAVKSLVTALYCSHDHFPKN